MRTALAATVLCLSAGSVQAQTREAGPWWPHPTYEIGQVHERGMPMFGGRHPLNRRPGPPWKR